MSTTIQNNFKEIRYIGGGAFGDVYLVEVLNKKLKREWGKDRVCIKVPKDKEKEELLLRIEITVNATIRKISQWPENLVEYVNFLNYRGYYSLVMEYVEGEILRNKIRGIGLQKPLSVFESLRIAKQVCKALSQLHKRKIFHRDVKPENIFVCKNQLVKLGDLGISKRMSSTGKASTIAGTWPYMAKEVLLGKGSFQSDIYSIGVVLYEMVTGELPFGDLYDEVSKNLNDPQFKVVPPKEYNIKEYNKDIDDALIEEINYMILKAIDLDLSKRHTTIDELYQEIDSILERLVEEPEEDFELSIEKAEKLSKDGKYTEAERKYKEVLKNFPKNPCSYLRLSEFYNCMKRSNEAENVLNEGIKKLPNSSLFYYNLALILHEKKDLTGALKNLEKALEIGLPKKEEKTARIWSRLWKK